MSDSSEGEGSAGVAGADGSNVMSRKRQRRSSNGASSSDNESRSPDRSRSSFRPNKRTRLANWMGEVSRAYRDADEIYKAEYLYLMHHPSEFSDDGEESGSDVMGNAGSDHEEGANNDAVVSGREPDREGANGDGVVVGNSGGDDQEGVHDDDDDDDEDDDDEDEDEGDDNSRGSVSVTWSEVMADVSASPFLSASPTRPLTGEYPFEIENNLNNDDYFGSGFHPPRAAALAPAPAVEEGGENAVEGGGAPAVRGRRVAYLDDALIDAGMMRGDGGDEQYGGGVENNVGLPIKAAESAIEDNDVNGIDFDDL